MIIRVTLKALGTFCLSENGTYKYPSKYHIFGLRNILYAHIKMIVIVD